MAEVWKDPKNSVTKRWMTVGEAAKYLGCSPQTVRTVLRSGSLRASRLVDGGPYLIDRLELDRFLERRLRHLPPYRKGSKPWVAKRHAEGRAA